MKHVGEGSCKWPHHKEFCVHYYSYVTIDLGNSYTNHQKWRALLACGKCKQCLTQYLGHEMLTLVQQLLSSTRHLCAT